MLTAYDMAAGSDQELWEDPSVGRKEGREASPRGQGGAATEPVPWGGGDRPMSHLCGPAPLSHHHFLFLGPQV